MPARISVEQSELRASEAMPAAEKAKKSRLVGLVISAPPVSRIGVDGPRHADNAKPIDISYKNARSVGTLVDREKLVPEVVLDRGRRWTLALHGYDPCTINRLLAFDIRGRSHGNPGCTRLPVKPVERLLNRNTGSIRYEMSDGEVIREDRRVAVPSWQIHRDLFFREGERFVRRIERQNQSAECIGWRISIKIGE